MTCVFKHLFIQRAHTLYDEDDSKAMIAEKTPDVEESKIQMLPTAVKFKVSRANTIRLHEWYYSIG